MNLFPAAGYLIVFIIGVVSGIASYRLGYKRGYLKERRNLIPRIRKNAPLADTIEDSEVYTGSRIVRPGYGRAGFLPGKKKSEVEEMAEARVWAHKIAEKAFPELARR